MILINFYNLAFLRIVLQYDPWRENRFWQEIYLCGKCKMLRSSNECFLSCILNMFAVCVYAVLFDLQVDYGATADELEMYFNGCGHVNRVTIPYNRFTGHPKGYVSWLQNKWYFHIQHVLWVYFPCSFAYIEFSERESVRTAMTLDETLFRGRVIKVRWKCSTWWEWE